jgi:MPBQ/MSBQ methyltransferase
MQHDILDAITQDEINLELLICTDVLKLESLHFGLWNDDEHLTLSNLRAAQARYTKHLIAQIPGGVQTVLDVGCGVGDVARGLARAGYAVTAISPDRNHEKYVNGTENGSVAFHNVRFEAFDHEETFDLILMSESQNYFDADIGFRQCRRFLREGGHLIVSGMLKKYGATAFEQMTNVEEDYLEKARRHSFQMTASTDITERVLPTMELARRAYSDYLQPATKVAELYWERTSKLKRALIRLFFRREAERLSSIRAYYEDYIDPETFRRNVRYVTKRFVYAPGNLQG